MEENQLQEKEENPEEIQEEEEEEENSQKSATASSSSSRVSSKPSTPKVGKGVTSEIPAPKPEVQPEDFHPNAASAENPSPRPTKRVRARRQE